MWDKSFFFLSRYHVLNPCVFSLFPALVKLCACSCLHSDLKRKANSVKNYRAKIELLGSYDPQKQLIIKDPYYVSIKVNSHVEYLQA